MVTFPFQSLAGRLLRTFAVVALAACSSSSSSNNSTPPPVDAGNGTQSNGNGGTCCLNGAFYNCTSQAAFNQCAGFDINACMNACSPADQACMNTCFMKWSSAPHDPSACQRDRSMDGTCSGGSNPPPADAGGTCSDDGANCTSDDQCCHSNCYLNTCYGNSSGDHCSSDSNCISNNCYLGTCQ